MVSSITTQLMTMYLIVIANSNGDFLLGHQVCALSDWTYYTNNGLLTVSYV